MLAEITPGKLRGAFRTTGGSESVELATASRAVCSPAARSSSPSKAPTTATRIAIRALGVTRDHARRSTSRRSMRVETALKKRDVAAFIMEPIICNLGALVADARVHARRRRAVPPLRHALHRRRGRHAVLAGPESCSPASTTSSSPTSCAWPRRSPAGVAPMGATIMTEEVADGLDDDFRFYSTYGWHPLASRPPSPTSNTGSATPARSSTTSSCAASSSKRAGRDRLRLRRRGARHRPRRRRRPSATTNMRASSKRRAASLASSSPATKIC